LKPTNKVKPVPNQRVQWQTQEWENHIHDNFMQSRAISDVDGGGEMHEGHVEFHPSGLQSPTWKNS